MSKRKKKDDYPRAIVREINGQLVLDDPNARAVIGAVSKHNCKNTLEINADRVSHFKKRLAERGMTADQAVIVLLNVETTFTVARSPTSSCRVTTGRRFVIGEKSLSRAGSPCATVSKRRSARSTRMPRRSSKI